jgi:hypothetical protein
MKMIDKGSLRIARAENGYILHYDVRTHCGNTFDNCSYQCCTMVFDKGADAIKAMDEMFAGTYKLD